MDEDLFLLEKEFRRNKEKENKQKENDKVIIKKMKLLKLIEDSLSDENFLFFVEKFYPFENKTNEKTNKESLSSLVYKTLKKGDLNIFKIIKKTLEDQKFDKKTLEDQNSVKFKTEKVKEILSKNLIMQSFENAKIIHANLVHNIMHLTVENPFEMSLFESSYCNLIKLKEVSRPYTPVAVNKKEIDFLIKIYKIGDLTPNLKGIKSGEYLEISQPLPKLKYNKFYEKVFMIAGGTGITPMYQVLKKAKEMHSETEFTLLFSNSFYEDLFLSKELEELKKHLKNFKIVYIFSKEKNKINKFEFEENNQRIDSEMLKKYKIEDLKNCENKLIYVCGPDKFLESVCGQKNEDKSQGILKGMLKKLGFKSEDVYKF